MSAGRAPSTFSARYSPIEWWRPENSRISAAGSAESRSDSDTSCRAATQPSVLSESRATSSPSQRQPVQVDEERAGLVDVEAQRRGVDLGQLAADPQPGERQARAGAAGEDQRHVGRREVQQVDQRVVHLRVVDQVPVVERQHEPPRVPRDQLQQRGERVAPGVLGALLDQLLADRRGRRRPPGAPGARPPAGATGTSAGRCRRGAGRARRPSPPSSSQHPQPLHGQGRLAVARRCVDDDELAARTRPAASRAAAAAR